MDNYYKTDKVTKKVADLLNKKQGELGITQLQMAQRLDMPLRTYKRLVNPKNKCIVHLETLGKIFENSDITYDDIFNGIYRTKQ